jgi:hypothetical protein
MANTGFCSANTDYRQAIAPPWPDALNDADMGLDLGHTKPPVGENRR